MPRRRICRCVEREPEFALFKPAGVKASELEDSVLTLGEFEALRLVDLESIGQEDAAKKMKLSQPTLHRLVSSARKKVVEALVKGKVIRIEGGNYEIVSCGCGGRRRGNK